MAFTVRAGITAETPVQFTAPLPARADVVVIGGGVIGVMTAWYLAERGEKVVLCEKGRIAGEQSSRNWGWVRQQGRDHAELPIMMEASRIWGGLAEEAGEDLGFRREGVLYVAADAKKLADYEDWREKNAVPHQLDTRVLTPAELGAMVPMAGQGAAGGLWTASDGRAEPWVAVPALARAVRRKGVTVVENCAVRSLDIAGGRVAGVVTEQGRIAADRVVLAGGAWSSLFLRNHGVAIPQLSVRSTVAATEPLPEVFAGNVYATDHAFRRRQDGGYTLAPRGFHEVLIGPDAFRHFRKYLPALLDDFSSNHFLWRAPDGYPDAWSTPRRWKPDELTPFERMRVLDPQPNQRIVEQFRARFENTFPQLGTVRIARAWAGMIDAMPDAVPVVDHIPALPGLTLATGMSGHGFGIGPAMGRIVADMVTGRPAGHDMTRFRWSRFTDGSKLELGPGV